MPAAEATPVLLEDERNAYELAFHILPTVAEGEVPGVFDSIKALITKDNGEIFDEEAPERFELAYEIVKHMEGKNRKFTSAYFAWVRFNAPSDAIERILEEVSSRPDILRHLMIKLTKVEQESPFRFHAALVSTKKMVTTINEEELTEASQEKTEEAQTETETVDMAEVEKTLNEGDVK